MLAHLLFLIATASAQDEEKKTVSTTFSDDFEVRYYVDERRLPDPSDVSVFNYFEQINRLNASISQGDVTFEAQIDEVTLFANQYFLDGELFSERDLVVDGLFNPLGPLSEYTYATVEKSRIRVEKKHYSVAVGDVYAAFGRGISLNMNRNVDIDIDSSIQGAKGIFRPGDWDITMVAGQINRQQVFQDNVNGDIYGELRHSVGGVRVERFGLGPANLGAHGVVYDFVEEPGWGAGFQELGTTPDALVGGATAELIGVGGIDFYTEADVFSFPTDVLPATLGPQAQDDPGYAIYSSAAFYPGKTVWLIEGKRYYQAERVNSLLGTELYEVVVAPSLEYERSITEDSSAAVNSNDTMGGRVRMDYAAVPGELTPFVSLGVFRDKELGGLHFNRSPETIIHALTGWELLKPEGAAIVNMGYRVDKRDRASDGADRQLHGDAAIKFPLGALHADVAINAERYQWGNNQFQQDDYTEIETGLSLARGSDISFTWFTDFSDNPLVNSTGNLTDTMYAAAELQVKPSPNVTLKAFYGAYKAGIRCSGGQCRLLPGFDGTRVNIQANF